MERIHRQLLIFVASITLIAVVNHDAIAVERLGLHVTQEELTIWKQRAANGPYKIKGDVSANSPGDWQRILGNANSFLKNPPTERWKGQQSGCWKIDGSPVPSRPQGEKLRDAGFVYLITGETKYRDAVLKELLAQAVERGTNFADKSRWCDIATDNRHNNIAMWLTKLLFAFDYIRESISASDRDTLNNWFENAAIHFEKTVDSIVTKRFPNRDRDDYTLGSGENTALVCTFAKCTTHYGGWKRYNFHEAWSNRNSSQTRFFTLVGILTNNSYLKNQGKRYFKEWLRYGVFPDGTDHDYHRWTGDTPSKGWSYSVLGTAAMVTVADHFARIGDTELYDYVTSAGIGKLTPAGGPKSLKQVIIVHGKHVNHSIMRYGTDIAANSRNPKYLISSIDGLRGLAWVYDIHFAEANVYYKDSFIKSIYMRTAQGAPKYPAKVSTGGYGAWCGEWGIYPGVLFMFGQMEGKVWPYPTSAASTAPAPPTGLRVRVE